MTSRAWIIIGLVGCVLATGCVDTIATEAVLSVKDYGATGDGETLDSPSIQKAIDDCNSRGGGEVLVPPGNYVCGTILLKDGVRLHLQKGAVILGSRNLDDYDNPDFFVDAVDQERGWCLIGIVDVKRAAITGEGIIDGRGQREFFKKRRPFLVRCVRSTNIEISGVTLRNPAAWTCHLFQSDGVTIQNLTIYSHANGNNDGIDIDSTKNVLIENCTIDSGDDAVCIKATSPMPTENVTVRNCVLTSDWGAFKLGTESMGDFKNIRFTDSVIKDTKGGAMKILSMDGCRLEDLTIDNITVTNSDMLLFMRLGVRLNKYREAEARTPGHIRDVTISNIKADMSPKGKINAPTGIIMLGEKTDDMTHMIENVVIKNVDVMLEGGGRIEDVAEIPERTRNNNYPEYIFFVEKSATRIFPAYGIYARHINGVTFENVNIVTRTPDTRPCVFLENANDVKLDAKTNPGNGPFIETKDSSKISRSKEPLTWPGEKSSFHSFAQYDFEIEGIPCKVVVPEQAAAGKPWIWRARFWGHQPQTDLALLERGFHVAYIDVAGLFGSPEAVRRWDLFYDYLTRTHGFDKKAVLEGMSRGGLIVFNWASKNPEKVHCIYADAPVCDFKSWPGGKKGAEKQWQQCLDAYVLTEESARTYKGNPVDNLEPLAKANVPILVVVGDADDVVPVSENTALVEKRYRELGEKITVIYKPDVGHHPHSLEDPKPIVDFILRYALSAH